MKAHKKVDLGKPIQIYQLNKQIDYHQLLNQPLNQLYRQIYNHLVNHVYNENKLAKL
jgi:predicted transcriptional regulator